MDFGLFLMGQHDSAAEAAFAEEHGFASVGLVDSQLLGGETFARLAQVATVTRRIRVGPFLAIPHNRPATVAAQGVATINAIAPGRTFFATGTGYSSRNVMGLPPLKAAAMRDYARDVRTLLAGGEIPADGRPDSPRVRFCQTEGRYLDLERHIPVYVAGDGPKALAAAGEAGEGWITTLQRGPMMDPAAVQVFAASLTAVREAAPGVARPRAILSTSACVLAPGERVTDDRVIARIGPAAMLPFHTAAQNPVLLESFPPSWRDSFEVYRRSVLERMPPDRLHQEVHRGHLTHLLPGEAECLSAELIRATTLTGTREELIKRLTELAAAGLDEVVLNFPAGRVREGVVEVARELLPALSGGSGR
jgi:alkanesulfonate monooxygenase SsuD/methylene tetrahydromethanopterin reductase-like flavin-dependent oxidoreductase (luciferase family)